MSQLSKHGTAFRAYFTTKWSRKYLGNRSVGENTVINRTNKSNTYIHLFGFGAAKTYHIPNPATAITKVGDSADVLKMTSPISNCAK